MSQNRLNKQGRVLPAIIIIIFTIIIAAIFMLPIIPVNKDMVVDAVAQTLNQEKFNSEYQMSGSISYDLLGVAPIDVAIEERGIYSWDRTDSDTNFVAKRVRTFSLLDPSINYFYNIGDYLIEVLDEEKAPDITYLNQAINYNYFGANDLSNDILNMSLTTDASFETKTLLGKAYTINNIYLLGANYLNMLFEISDPNLLTNLIVGMLSVEVRMHMIIQDGYMTEYSYDINYTRDDLTFSISYSQTFKENNLDEIGLPDNSFIKYGNTFDNEMLIIENAINEILNEDSFTYDFSWRSEVDQGILYPSIGLYLRGTHMQTTINDEVYFNNYYELDSDYKPDLEDVKKYRVKLNNDDKEVWDEIIIALWPNDFNIIEDYSASIEEDFMFVNIWNILDNIDFLGSTYDDNEKLYIVPINRQYILLFIEELENMIDFDVYDIDSELLFENVEVSITLPDSLDEISISIILNGSYLDSDDIVQYFDCEYEIELYYFDVGNEYIPPVTKEDIS
ncbi:hypothetical protein RJI07_04005 [Mycoplasmatota bacterium WC30]